MLPTSNIRGFFEILMPGVFLVLNVALTIFLLTSMLIPQPVPPGTGIEQFLTNPVIAGTLLIVYGYPVGMALRLLKTSRIDTISARYIAFWDRKSRESLYLTDHFFYGNWMRQKLRNRMPVEMARFFEEYWFDKYTSDGNQNTSFFNLCKTIIAKVDIQSGNEVYAAEAVSRFLAGSYYALLVSIVLLCIDLIIVITQIHYQWIILIITLLIAYLLLLHVILSQFRFLRAKEVDTVFNASFANRKAFARLFPTPASRRLMSIANNPESDARRALILNAWGEHLAGGRLVQSLDLDKLLTLMKQESVHHPYLSSLYFAGSEVDHPFFLENTCLALGLAVLPEDAPKAGLHKRHPHQTEVVFVLRGSVCIHYEEDGVNWDKEVAEGGYFVIPPDTCHWITLNGSEEAAYMFVKTNPSEEPRGINCS